jgi:hypothetical protein
MENWKARAVSTTLVKYLDFCVVKVESENYWQQATHYICPFECCLDQKMIFHKYPPDKTYFKAIETLKSNHLSPKFGYGRYPIFEKPYKLSRHLALHLFSVNLNKEALKFDVGLRKPLHNNVLMCGLLNCVKSFGDSEDGCKQRLLHLANDHQLPIFMNEKQEFIKYVQPEKLNLDRLGPYQLLAKHKKFKDSRQDDDLYFHWNGNTLKYHLKKVPRMTETSDDGGSDEEEEPEASTSKRQKRKA